MLGGLDEGEWSFLGGCRGDAVAVHRWDEWGEVRFPLGVEGGGLGAQFAPDVGLHVVLEGGVGGSLDLCVFFWLRGFGMRGTGWMGEAHELACPVEAAAVAP